MAVTRDIVQSWRGPRAAIRRMLPAATEASALTYLMIAALLLIVAQAPRLAREAQLDPAVPIEARILATAMAILAFLPPFAYALAALSHLVARLFGGRGTWRGARLALFWSLLAAAPLFLANGLVAGLLGNGPVRTLTEAVVLAGFLVHWLLALAETESARGA